MKVFFEEYGRSVLVAIIIVAVLVGGIALACENSSAIEAKMSEYIGNVKVDDNDVVINNNRTFTLDGESYNFDKDMTWAQWVQSSYNTIKAKEDVYDNTSNITAIDVSSIKTGEGKFYIEKNKTIVKTTDKITQSNYTITNIVDSGVKSLIFNKNGGTDGPGSVEMIFEEATVIPTTEPTREGYVFLSWNTKKDGTGTVYKANDVFKKAKVTPADTVTLYAQWKENTATLTLDLQGGTGVSSNIEMKYSSSTSLPSTKPSKTGFEFKEWNTYPNGKGSAYAPGDTYKSSKSAPISATLYAIYVPKKSTLTYDVQGGSPEISSVTMTYAGETKVLSEEVTKTGYKFKSWNTRENGSGTAYSAGEIIKAANSDPESITLYAQWTENTATLTYDANDGTGASKEVILKYTASASVSEDVPTREGYVFDSWNTNKNGSGASYTSGAALKAAKTNPSDITLYAQWTEAASELAYDLQDGTGVITSVQMRYTTNTKITDVVPTKTGCIFKGWNTKADGSGTPYASGAEFKASNVVPTDTTLYAQWLEKYDVSYCVHVADSGWLDWVKNGASAGSSLRIEAFKIALKTEALTSIDGDVSYRAHVQDYGWESGWKKNSALSGTTGESKRIEAIQIKLTGDMAEKYDIYYRVNAQDNGWLGWAKNGESAGTQGLSLQLNSIQVVLVEKGESAPGSTANAFKS